MCEEKCFQNVEGPDPEPCCARLISLLIQLQSGGDSCILFSWQPALLLIGHECRIMWHTCAVQMSLVHKEKVLFKKEMDQILGTGFLRQ